MTTSSEKASAGGPARAASTPTLVVDSVSKSFGSRRTIDGLSVVLESGESLAILGRSGTGKSVLLKLITGLLEPDSGDVVLWGQSTRGLREEEWYPLRRRLGMVFQAGALFDSMSVFDNIAFPLRERGELDREEIAEAVAEKLRWVGLSGMEEYAPSDLSGGQRRRVAVARTLAFRPELILYDEPTTGLDPLTARQMSFLMRDLGERVRSTSILVTHDIDCARVVAGRWAYLSEGKVVADGTPEELTASRVPELRDFFHGGAGDRTEAVQ